MILKVHDELKGSTGEGGISVSEYRVEWSHINKASLKGSRQLIANGIRGMTICAVVASNVVALGAVFCSEADNFSKSAGRLKSLKRTLESCPKIPREHIPRILSAYEDYRKEERGRSLSRSVANQGGK
jgi:hypothetical protein